MRVGWLVLIFALPLLGAAADPQNRGGVKYPEDLPRPTYLAADDSLHKIAQQEYVEVSAPEYPGLRIELPPLRNLIAMPRPSLQVPSRTPAYYTNGGMILNFWGVPLPCSEVISVDVLDPKKMPR